MYIYIYKHAHRYVKRYNESSLQNKRARHMFGGTKKRNNNNKRKKTETFVYI